MHLVSFTVEIYYDARPYKRQKYSSYLAENSLHYTSNYRSIVVSENHSEQKHNACINRVVYNTLQVCGTYSYHYNTLRVCGTYSYHYNTLRVCGTYSYHGKTVRNM